MNHEPFHTVFLTGASAGIGLATARVLTDSGYEVWGTSRDPVRLPALSRFHPVRMNLNDPESVRAAFAQAETEAGGVDVLINNAGEVVNGPLEVVARADMRPQFEALFFGPLELIRLALPGMRRRNRGLILNITSLAVQFPIPFNSGYNAAKAALSAATDSLRLELTGTGVRAVDLQPGDTATEILRRTRELATPECAAYEPWLSRARAAEAENMRHATAPERIALVIARILRNPAPPPRVAAGSFFEARLAPLASRFMSRRALEWAQRKFYKLGGN